MDDKLVFENYQFDNWHLVNELFDAVYGADSDKFPSWAELNWRYRNDLFKSVIWVAKSNNEQIVAMRPTVIKSVRIGGEKLTAVHFMDAMTHPDFRRQGLFTRLTHLLKTFLIISRNSSNTKSMNGFLSLLRETIW